MEGAGSSSVSDNSSSSETTRVPLSEVVSDCVKRWFRDTLKEAKGGDINMQVLVGQMYFSGYGVARDAQKVFFFLFFLWVSMKLLCFLFGGFLVVKNIMLVF